MSHKMNDWLAETINTRIEAMGLENGTFVQWAVEKRKRYMVFQMAGRWSDETMKKWAWDNYIIHVCKELGYNQPTIHRIERRSLFSVDQTDLWFHLGRKR